MAFLSICALAIVCGVVYYFFEVSLLGSMLRVTLSTAIMVTALEKNWLPSSIGTTLMFVIVYVAGGQIGRAFRDRHFRRIWNPRRELGAQSKQKERYYRINRTRDRMTRSVRFSHFCLIYTFGRPSKVIRRNSYFISLCGLCCGQDLLLQRSGIVLVPSIIKLPHSLQILPVGLALIANLHFG